MKRYSTRPGFTLIELLVVIAIIAILAAILFPVFAQAREKGRQAACISNMKQIALAEMMYAQDFDETVTALWRYGNDAQVKRTETPPVPEYWHIFLQPYIKSYKIFICPSCGADAGKPKLTPTYPNGTSCDVHDPADPVQHSTAWDNYHIGSGSYAINNCYTRDNNIPNAGGGGPVSIAQVSRPADKILIAEFDKNWHPAALYLPLAAQNLTPTTPGCGSTSFGFLWGPTDRHTGVRVVAYWDGHVKALRGGRTLEDTNPNGGNNSQTRNAAVDRHGDLLSTDPRQLIAFGTGSDL